jgi:4-diphosphocytidyl-2-C-methyl-D-erythritol kinase
MTSITCAAPAKLNLFLHVVGRQPDGYHLLQTVFRFIDLQDTLHFTLRQDGQIKRSNAIDGVAEKDDLCIRAAQLLQNEAACRFGVDIKLEKHIPMGGGLGGGSSDAATTLLALNRLWQLNFSREKLMQLGLKLGADVPVFIFGENAFAEGIGEKLQPFRLPETWYIVLSPPVHVPTAKIFTHPELTRNTISITMRALPIGGDFQAAGLGNDLQKVACQLYPEIEQYLKCLSQFAPALMTGSGACIFAAFTSESAAKAVLIQLPSNMRGWIAKGLRQHPLHDFVSS